MEKGEAKKRIEKLKKVINHHRYLYHVLNKQEISEAALDSLKHDLYKLEQQFPEFVTLDSPTQRVAGEPQKQFKKVEHKFPMLSLEDIFTEKELQDWEDYLKRLEPSAQIEYFAELKVDGFAIALIYDNGIFKTGATRGDGRIGEDVTQNLKTIESIPLKLELKKSILGRKIEESLKKAIKRGKFEVRGEVFMEKAAFEKLNSELAKKGEKTYSNPRNLAAGSIRQLGPRLTASRPLKFLAYDTVSDTGQLKHSEEHQILVSLGFRTDKGRVCNSLSDAVDFWRNVAKKREILPFQIDGVVINVNNNALFSKLGVAGKSPRAARAFKFSPKQATTRVLDIKLQIGRTGVVTPVAVLEPVKVSGVTITRATLHNEDEIKRLGIKIGDTAIVERAGDVIPDIAKVLSDLRTGKEKDFHFPKNCPSCSVKLKKLPNEVLWRCPNANCPAVKRENLYHFVSKKAFDIDGLGPKIIDKLVDEKIITQAVDIFGLKEGDLVPLERFAEKSAKNLTESIEKSKKISLPKFIFSLAIRHVGEETASDLADYFNSINKLKKAKKDELEKINNVGQKMAESIYRWFNSKQNQKFIEELFAAGVGIINEKPKIKNQKLKGLSFVITGILPTMTRGVAIEKIRLFGGQISESVSKMTDFLIVGENPGSKLKKAQKLRIKTINEKDFLMMLK
jgi:DNA ligase (NAD+)